jgi:rod shape-determining protein MreC
VLMVFPSVSQVLLINDQSSGVGAILEKTRLQGVLRGTANGEVALERVMSDEQVPVGETILTSGGDQIFPKGLPVGTVMKVGNGKDLFLNIKIKPAANLSKLEEVLVLVEKQERPAVAEDNVRVRAADILAQRLPSVPDKPATVANPATGTTEGSAKPAGTAAPSGKSSSGVNAGPVASGASPVGKPAGAAAVKKSPSVPGAPATGAKPNPSQSAPKSVPPKTAAPAPPAAPPSNTQPSANESSPQ